MKPQIGFCIRPSLGLYLRQQFYYKIPHSTLLRALIYSSLRALFQGISKAIRLQGIAPYSDLCHSARFQGKPKQPNWLIYKHRHAPIHIIPIQTINEIPTVVSFISSPPAPFPCNPMSNRIMQGNKLKQKEKKFITGMGKETEKRKKIPLSSPKSLERNASQQKQIISRERKKNKHRKSPGLKWYHKISSFALAASTS